MVYHATLTLVVAFALTSISTVVVAFRFYARYFLVGKLGSPDWVMLAALIVTWGTPILSYYQILYMDYGQATAPDGSLIVDEYKRIASGSLLTTWIFRLNYILDHMLIKVSILLFYNYVTAAHRAYYWIVRSTLVLVIVTSIIMAFVSIFICNPPQIAWDGDVFYNELFGKYPSECINPSVLWLTQAAYNLATDGIVWLLPIPFFLNLRSMPVRRRVELVAIFGVGILAIAASAVRLSVTLRWLSGYNEMAIQWTNILIWSQVEQHLGITAASIPFLRPIFRKIVKSVRTRSASSGGHLVPNMHFQEHPVPPRPPIIPSPTPTLGSQESFRPPVTPLSPIKPEMHIFQTV